MEGHGIYGDMLRNMQLIDGSTVHMARLAIYASSSLTAWPPSTQRS
jgi:hypothetical protein